MTSYPRSASRKGWKLPQTEQRTRWPSTSTSLTPEARAICRAGGGPTKWISTRWFGSSSVMVVSLRRQPGSRIDRIDDSMRSRPDVT
jgi:hypothetical protein